MWRRPFLSLHCSWRTRLTEDNSILGCQSKLYKCSQMSNAVNSKNCGTDLECAQLLIPFTFHSCGEKSFFVLPHYSTGRNYHQNTLPSVDANYLIGGRQWCMFLDWVKMNLFKMGKAASIGDASFFLCGRPVQGSDPGRMHLLRGLVTCFRLRAQDVSQFCPLGRRYKSTCCHQLPLLPLFVSCFRSPQERWEVLLFIDLLKLPKYKASTFFFISNPATIMAYHWVKGTQHKTSLSIF